MAQKAKRVGGGADNVFGGGDQLPDEVTRQRLDKALDRSLKMKPIAHKSNRKRAPKPLES